MPKKDDTCTISFRIPNSDKEKLLAIAAQEERSLSQLVRIIVQNYLKDK